MRKFISSSIIALTATVLLGATGFAGEWGMRRHDGQRQLALGLCAGQALAQQSVTIPTPERGQAPTALDAATREALASAIETCREQMRGEPTPTPSASPSPDPTEGDGTGTSTSSDASSS